MKAGIFRGAKGGVVMTEPEMPEMIPEMTVPVLEESNDAEEIERIDEPEPVEPGEPGPVGPVQEGQPGREVEEERVQRKRGRPPRVKATVEAPVASERRSEYPSHALRRR